MLRPSRVSELYVVAGASGSCSGHYNFHRWAGAPLCYLDGGSRCVAYSITDDNSSLGTYVLACPHAIDIVHFGGLENCHLI